MRQFEDFYFISSYYHTMPPFTSKELYIMNGGQKHYIGRDGFADVYDATPAEEAEWAQEIIQTSLSKIITEENSATLHGAIANLVFHKYQDLVTLLINSTRGATPAKQFVFASALWNMNCNESEFKIVFEILSHHNFPGFTDLFQRPADFKKHPGATHFLINCLEGNDEYLFDKAKTILSIWAWSGMPQLRENALLDKLEFGRRMLPDSQVAIQRLREILTAGEV